MQLVVKQADIDLRPSGQKRVLLRDLLMRPSANKKAQGTLEVQLLLLACWLAGLLAVGRITARCGRLT